MDLHQKAMIQNIITKCQFAIKAKADMDREASELKANITSGLAMHEMMRQNWMHHMRIQYANQTCLVALALVSRCLGFHRQVENRIARESLRQLLETDETSALYARDVRDCFEHMDERIDAHFRDGSTIFVDSNISLNNGLGAFSPGIEPIRHLALATGQVSARKKDGSRVVFSLDDAAQEARRIKLLAIKARNDARMEGFLWAEDVADPDSVDFY